MNKKLMGIIATLSLIITIGQVNYSYALSSDQKVITTSRTSSSKYGFPDTIPYEDAEGYSGLYQKDGEPYVISGSDASSKTVNTQQSSMTSYFPPTTPYSDGTFSGTLKFVRSEKVGKNVSGNASIQEAYNQICLVAGHLTYNRNYKASSFNYNDMTTWKAWEDGSVWGSPYVWATGNQSVSNGFTVNWSGSRATSVSYSSGGYSGTAKVSSPNISTSPRNDVYKSNPNNGYTLPNARQEVNVFTKTYNYSLSGLVYGSNYTGYYSGTVYKSDDRVWRQNYKGIAENLQVKANIERVLSPHDPVFKSGEKGIIKITVTGKAERLKITFPRELTMLDDTLNKEIILNKLSTETINYEFFVPLGAESKNYNVEVKVFKEGREKVTYPSFRVLGNVTDNLRTRIR